MVISVCRQYLLSAFLLASLIQSSQTCPTNLTNSVVYEGNQTSFQRLNDGLAVKWQVAPSSLKVSSLKEITPNYDNNVDSQFATTYAVNSTQLTIFSSTLAPQGSMPYSTAGIYILNYQNSGCRTGAGLAVIRSGPVCAVDTSNSLKPMLTCTVVYASYVQQQINPIMTWTNSSGAVVFQDNPPRIAMDVDNPGLQNATSKLTIASNDGSTYGCQLTFSPPQPLPLTYLAQNAPIFSASCFVHYTPPTTTGAPTTSTPSPSSQSTTTNTVTTPTQPQTTTSTTTPSTISSSSAASSISPLSSTTPTTAPPSDQTTSPATPIISGISANQAEAQAYAIVLSLVFGSVFALATVCFCWCCCCCKFPPPAGKTRRRRRRRGTRKPFFSWLMNYDSDNNDGI